MKKQFAAVLAGALISGAAFAGPAPGTLGVGIAHSEGTQGDGNTIYLPYTLNDGLWVEPFVSYSHIEDNNSDAEADALSIGAGLFKDFHSTAKTRAYFGGRLGYNYIDVENAAGNDSDGSGFLVQPVIGFGYEPVQNVIFGAEAFVAYQDSDLDDVNGADTESFGTGTSLFVRYFFNQ